MKRFFYGENKGLSGLAYIAAIGIIAGGTILVTKGCNRKYNTQDITTSAYHMVSEPKGLSGHTEYVHFTDGKKELKIYPAGGHRYNSSTLYIDFNGDGKVDEIRVNGSENRMNRLKELLVRDYDYPSHKQEFTDADKELKEAIAKYDR